MSLTSSAKFPAVMGAEYPSSTISKVAVPLAPPPAFTTNWSLPLRAISSETVALPFNLRGFEPVSSYRLRKLQDFEIFRKIFF